MGGLLALPTKAVMVLPANGEAIGVGVVTGAGVVELAQPVITTEDRMKNSRIGTTRQGFLYRFIFSPFPIPGSNAVSRATVAPSCEGYRLFSISRFRRDLGRTAPEKLVYVSI
jgi:hypothetical protein